MTNLTNGVPPHTPTNTPAATATATASVPQPRRPLRIAVLEADHPMPKTTAQYGSYAGVFTELLHAAATQLGWDPATSLRITAWDVEGQLQFPPSLDDLDAVLITGSRYSAYESTPWIVALVAYVRRILSEQTRVRVVGVCFGHQVIARALGATVAAGRDGWEASVCEVPLSACGTQLFGKDVLNIFQMHKDLVVDLPPNTNTITTSNGTTAIGTTTNGAANGTTNGEAEEEPDEIEIIGSTKLCKIHGMYSAKKRRFISIQGHPEYTPGIVSESLKIRADAGIFSPDQYREMMGRVNDRHDGHLIGAVFLKFIADGVVDL